MLIVGCFLCLLSVFIFGYDKSSHKATVFNGFCQVTTAYILLVYLSVILIYLSIGWNFDSNARIYDRLWFSFFQNLVRLHGVD